MQNACTRQFTQLLLSRNLSHRFSHNSRTQFFSETPLSQINFLRRETRIFHSHSDYLIPIRSPGEEIFHTTRNRCIMKKN